MRLAETVTFGGSNLDRAAHLRDDADQLAALRLRGKTLPLWRGKPLMAEDARLGWVDCASSLASATMPRFLPVRLSSGRPSTPW